MERNPWKTLSGRIIFQNEWMTIHENQVIRPDGEPGMYHYMETRVATGVVAITPRREVYLVGQYRYPTGVYSWEIPEGGCEAGEDPLTTARRELEEEAGLVAQTWTPLGGEVHLSNCISAERGYLFLAEDLTETAMKPDPVEVLQVKRVPLEECLQMAASGEIVDAMSIMGLFQANRHLVKRESEK